MSEREGSQYHIDLFRFKLKLNSRPNLTFGYCSVPCYLFYQGLYDFEWYAKFPPQTTNVSINYIKSWVQVYAAKTGFLIIPQLLGGVKNKVELISHAENPKEKNYKKLTFLNSPIYQALLKNTLHMC